jgi:hypothetical protein
LHGFFRSIKKYAQNVNDVLSLSLKRLMASMVKLAIVHFNEEDHFQQTNICFCASCDRTNIHMTARNTVKADNGTPPAKSGAKST